MRNVNDKKIQLFENAYQQVFHFLFLFCIILLFSGCGTLRHLKYPFKHTYDKVSAKNKGFTAEYPKSFTVYPFKNLTWDNTAAKRAQRVTAMAFSLIGPVASIPETAKIAADPYSYQDAIKIARKQKSDAIVIGEVMKQDSLFLILWSYSYVRMKLTVYDTKTGEVLWTGSSWAMSNDFGGLLFWIPIPSLTSVLKHLYWSRVVNSLYSRIAMDTIYTLRPDLLKLE